MSNNTLTGGNSTATWQGGVFKPKAIFVVPKTGIYKIQTVRYFFNKREEVNIYDIPSLDFTKPIDIHLETAFTDKVYKLNMSTGYYDIWNPSMDNDLELPKPAPKCQCGTSITMGKDDAPEYHSTWCPVYVKPKPEMGND